MKTLIWLSLKILRRPTSKLNHTVLHFQFSSLRNWEPHTHRTCRIAVVFTPIYKHRPTARVFCYSAIFVGTKDLKNGLADRTSKSKSIAFKSKSKSKSSKNGLKSGLESKSGLEYYKSANQGRAYIGVAEPCLPFISPSYACYFPQQPLIWLISHSRCYLETFLIEWELRANMVDKRDSSVFGCVRSVMQNVYRFLPACQHSLTYSCCYILLTVIDDCWVWNICIDFMCYVFLSGSDCIWDWAVYCNVFLSICGRSTAVNSQRCVVNNIAPS